MSRPISALLMTLLLTLPACGGKAGDTGDAPTYYQDIAPLLSENCGSCHVEGGIQPDILFDDAEDASNLSSLIADAVTNQRMPPFYAAETEDCENPWGWTNDTRLSDEEIALIDAWAQAGGPIGDEDDPAPLVPPSSTSIEDPDAIYAPTAPWTTTAVGETEDEFICFSIDPGLTEDAYITAFEVLPEDLSVVHHVLVGVDANAESDARVNEDGLYECFGGFGVDANFIGGWVPSAPPTQAPVHSAFLVPAGSRILLQMHYHLTDQERTDGTSLAVTFSEGTPVREAMVQLLGNANAALAGGAGLQAGPNDEDGLEFRVPADVSDHTETMYYNALSDIARPLDVFLVGNHMHYVGTDMRSWAARGETAKDANDAEDACLLQTPNWDFDWQQFYFYDVDGDNAPKLYAGDELWLECTYDNTLDNPGLKAALEESGLDAPIDVYLGESTLDEMCIGIFGWVLDVEFETEDETHQGEVDGTITVLGVEAACEGPASFSVTEDSVTGLARCGISFLGQLLTLEADLEGSIANGEVTGTATYGVAGVAGTFTLDFTGTSDKDGVELHSEGTESLGGYTVEVALDIHVE